MSESKYYPEGAWNDQDEIWRSIKGFKGHIFLLDNNIDLRLQQLSNRKHKSKTENELQRKYEQ